MISACRGIGEMETDPGFYQNKAKTNSSELRGGNGDYSEWKIKWLERKEK